MNTHALVRATVRSILERATDLEWSLQGFGMLRHYLTPTVRLHVWASAFRVKNVSTIHDHWDFRRGPIEAFEPGHWYEQRADEIHESLPVDGTVTLVERHFRADTEHARVYYSTPAWVSAEPRPASRREIAAAVRLAIARWE